MDQIKSKNMKLKIKVTKEILERSKMCGYSHPTKHDLIHHIQTNCAIALAVREIFPTCYVRTYEITESFVAGRADESDGWFINLPYEASNFITAFDSSEPEDRVKMSELEFEITVPQEVIDSISIEGIKELIKDSKTLELV